MGRILVIDDDARLRRMIVRAVKGAGHEIRDAADGDAGLQMVRAEQFDIVITDIVMPQKEGIETILAIRREHPSIRIIAISGGGESGTMPYLDFAAKLGADATLAKPFRPAELLETIDRMLKGGAEAKRRFGNETGTATMDFLLIALMIAMGIALVLSRLLSSTSIQ